ncbi:MAG: sn-glycerol-3-phosphate ABC transporter ATP-binding protein UgpC [Oceanospirillaceae bacterium]|nr:sn-glycerol-3-phosphate ABC transporter ATP-binding protein UgpC [Oceanospirillaceae bacterium]
MSSVLIKDLTLKYDHLTILDKLNMDIQEGEFLVLLGASGCGKSTLLNCIAGLLDISAGEIHINGKNVTWAEPSERGIGMVFQSYALYPQMTVEGNLTFGLKNAKVPKPEIAKRIAKVAEILQIESLLKRKPAALSGGQRQRVAIGRALVREVKVFLFDEPLSNLDAKLRADLRIELKLLHKRLKSTIIYVTHDQVEAMTLADRIAVMKNGVVQQLDTPNGIFHRPINRFVADFIGSPSMNFFEGELVTLETGQIEFKTAELVFNVSDYEFTNATPVSGKASLGIRPEAVSTGANIPDNFFSCDITVELVEPMGSDTLVWTKLAGQNFRFRMDGKATVANGDKLRIGFNPSSSSMFDAENEDRL